MLFREALGDTLRDLRLKRGLNLRDVATKAPMALGYLSEVERGQKELSSEFISHIALALNTDVSTIILETALAMREWEAQQSEQIDEELRNLVSV